MTLEEIELYLKQKNININDNVKTEIETHRVSAIKDLNEPMANYCWCLKQICMIQSTFLSAFSSLQQKDFKSAWLLLDSADIKIGCLQDNFDIEEEKDCYHIAFIGKILKEYQKLFPYRHFLSREAIVKEEKCSICGERISIRRSCGHKVGKVYMGELCLREITSIEFKAFAIVTDPFDKYSFLEIQDAEYDYGMIEYLMENIHNPYDEFEVETIKVKSPEYLKIGRNDKCPCGSGMKYKKCHRGTSSELINHYKVHLLNSKNGVNRPIKYFGTWK